jgi:FMN-dependent NADH-azoreductase
VATARPGGDGLEPRFIAAELTLAELIPLAAKSLAAAEQAIDGLWSPSPALAYDPVQS